MMRMVVVMMMMMTMMAIGCLMLVYWELVQTMLSQVIPFNSPHLREVNEDDAEF